VVKSVAACVAADWAAVGHASQNLIMARLLTRFPPNGTSEPTLRMGIRGG
jgi:hypothetical protein